VKRKDVVERSCKMAGLVYFLGAYICEGHAHTVPLYLPSFTPFLGFISVAKIRGEDLLVIQASERRLELLSKRSCYQRGLSKLRNED